MFLKKGVAEGLLIEANMTRAELAKELDCPLSELNPVLDGTMESGTELGLLLISAFGAEVINGVTDWERSG